MAAIFWEVERNESENERQSAQCEKAMEAKWITVKQLSQSSWLNYYLGSVTSIKCLAEDCPSKVFSGVVVVVVIVVVMQSSLTHLYFSYHEMQRY